MDNSGNILKHIYLLLAITARCDLLFTYSLTYLTGCTLLTNSSEEITNVVTARTILAACADNESGYSISA